MAQVTITINSREYAIACEDGQEVRILQLSRILEEKAVALTANMGRVNENTLLAYIGLILADEISELKKYNTANGSNSSPVDSEKLSKIDAELAQKINLITNEINSIAQKLNS